MSDVTTAVQTPRFSMNFSSPLLALLQREADRRGHSFEELANKLGHVSPLLQQLKSGMRPKHLDETFVKNCAEYLKAPVLSVLLAVGEITQHTLSYSLPHLERHVIEALGMLREDTAFSCYAKLDATTLDPLARNLIVALYAKSFLAGVTH